MLAFRTTTVRALALIALALAMAACGEDGPAANTDQAAPRRVKTFTVGAPDLGWTRTFTGTVQANDSAQLAFLVPGRLIEYPVNDGQTLKRGQLIGRLDPRDFQNRVDAAQAMAEAAKVRLDKLKMAHAKSAVSEIEVIEQGVRHRTTLSGLKIAEKALADTELRAPFDGVVAETLVDRFEDLDAAQPVVLFHSADTIEIEVAIPEQDLVHASEQSPGRFTARFQSLPGRTFELAFKEVVTQADAVTQTYTVGLMMPSPRDANILPGMTAEVTWQRDTNRADAVGLAVEVPVSATFSQPNGDVQVWVIDPDSMAVAKRRVRLGALRGGESIAVLDGLEPGDLIAAAGVHHLRDGMTVRRMNGTALAKAPH